MINTSSINRTPETVRLKNLDFLNFKLYKISPPWSRKTLSNEFSTLFIPPTGMLGPNARKWMGLRKKGTGFSRSPPAIMAKNQIQAAILAFYNMLLQPGGTILILQLLGQKRDKRSKLTVLNRFRTIVKEDIVKDFFISLKI
jgi:hypothetical protein